MKYLIASLFTITMAACSSSRKKPHFQEYERLPLSQNSFNDSKLLTDLFAKNADQLGQVIRLKDSFRLQIIFTQIDRDEKNQPHFTNHLYHVTDQYFYPASTVKFPTAILALEKLNKLSIPGVDAGTTMLTDSAWPGQSMVWNDPNSATGRPSVGNYVKKILLVSDNDAFNRLYEFIGQDPLNQRLFSLGFKDAQVIHRLSIPLSQEQNRHTNPVRFLDSTGKPIFTQPMKYSDMAYQLRNDLLGSGYMASGSNYYAGDSLVKGPMDFSKKNRMRLPYLHQVLQWVMFPATQPRTERLKLTAADYQFVRKYMSMFPGESNFPNYDTTSYWPAYCKFLMMGNQKGAWPNPDVRIFNKVGDAYGFLIDVSYIVDFKTKTEFMVSCSMLCNTDGIFNDDKYDYETIGFPFMKNLGLILYEYEKQRPKKYLPDLKEFQMNYKL